MMRLDEEIKELFVKIIIPAIIVISSMLMVKKQVEGRLTGFTIFSAYGLGIGACYLCRNLIFKYFPGEESLIPVAVLAIGAKDLIKYALYRAKWDELGKWLLEIAKSWIDNKLRK